METWFSLKDYLFSNGWVKTEPLTGHMILVSRENNCPDCSPDGYANLIPIALTKWNQRRAFAVCSRNCGYWKEY